MHTSKLELRPITVTVGTRVDFQGMTTAEVDKAIGDFRSAWDVNTRELTANLIAARNRHMEENIVRLCHTGR